MDLVIKLICKPFFHNLASNRKSIAMGAQKTTAKAEQAEQTKKVHQRIARKKEQMANEAKMEQMIKNR